MQMDRVVAGIWPPDNNITSQQMAGAEGFEPPARRLEDVGSVR